MPKIRPKSIAHTFAHLAFPGIALGNHLEAYHALTSDSGTRYLVQLWEDLELKTGTRANRTGLLVSNVTSGPGFQILIITMPPPSDTSDAIFIGLLFFLGSGARRKTPLSCRYFTLEFHLPPTKDHNAQSFCEWIGIPPNLHVKYGYLPDVTEDTFRTAILSKFYGQDGDYAAPITDPYDSKASTRMLFDASLEEATKGNFDEAMLGFSLVVDLDPANAEAHYHLGKAKLNLGELYGAVSDMSRSLELDPESDVAYNDRGIARKKLGDLRGAISDYSQALRINPTFYRVYLNRGMARYEIGDEPGACRDFMRAAKHGVPGARSGLIQAGCDRIDYQ